MRAYSGSPVAPGPVGWDRVLSTGRPASTGEQLSEQYHYVHQLLYAGAKTSEVLPVVVAAPAVIVAVVAVVAVVVVVVVVVVTVGSVTNNRKLQTWPSHFTLSILCTYHCRHHLLQ